MMKRNKLIVLSALIALTMSSCQLFRSSKTASPQINDGHNSANSLDWSGYYSGNILSKDGISVHYVLQLLPDSSFVLTSSSVGADPTVEKGRFVWSVDGDAIALSGIANERCHYWVQENRLQLLTPKGKKYSPELAAKYVLNKNSAMSDLFGKKWSLVSLHGETLSLTSDRIPYMLFDAKENRVNGFAGCNRFFGSIELKENNRLRFAGVGATRMACQDMKVEDELFDVFNQFDSYILVGNQLQLIKGRMAPLAVFEYK